MVNDFNDLLRRENAWKPLQITCVEKYDGYRSYGTYWTYMTSTKLAQDPQHFQLGLAKNRRLPVLPLRVQKLGIRNRAGVTIKIRCFVGGCDGHKRTYHSTVFDIPIKLRILSGVRLGRSD